jgi:hypothetical protein
LKNVFFFYLLSLTSLTFSVEAKKLSPNIVSIFSGIVLGEAYSFLNKGLFSYPEVTLSSKKKSYSSQVYDKIFQEGPVGVILDGLYKEIFVDFCNKRSGSDCFSLDHHALFKEILFLVMGWRKSFLKIKTGVNIVFEKKNNFLYKEEADLYATAFLVGISKFFVDEKLKNFIKDRLNHFSFMKEKPSFVSICNEMLRIGLTEIFILPGYYTCIGLLTLSCSHIAKEKNKVVRGLIEGLEKKSVADFYSNVEETDLFLVSEAGYTGSKVTSSLYKIFSLCKKLI